MSELSARLREAANRATRYDADVALLCECAIKASGQMERTEADGAMLLDALKRIECEPICAEYTAREAIDKVEADDDNTCPHCNGTGEGSHDGARCGHCKGRG